MFLVLLYSLFKGKDGMFKMFIIAPISFPILIVTMSVEWAVK